MQTIPKKHMCRWLLPGLLGLVLCEPVPNTYAAMNLLVGVGIPVRTVSAYKILHDKVIVTDGRNTQVGSFNFSRAADRSNLENMLVVWDDPVLARSYLNHWTSRWTQGTDWKQTY